MCRHCSSLRNPRWHLQARRAGCLASRASCPSRHSAATCSPRGDTAASAAHSSKPRYNASHWGSAEHTLWASTQSVGEGGKGKMVAEDGNTPKRGRKEIRVKRVRGWATCLTESQGQVTPSSTVIISQPFNTIERNIDTSFWNMWFKNVGRKVSIFTGIFDEPL